jgi:hypothetical protein
VGQPLRGAAARPDSRAAWPGTPSTAPPAPGVARRPGRRS